MKRDELIQEIIETIHRCQRAAVNPSDWSKIGLSRSQVGMLFMIHHHSDANVKKISEHLGVTKSALVTNGFLDRQNDVTDRRIVRFNLTGKGKKVLKEITKLKFSGLRTALDNLSDKELEQLAKLHIKALQK
jgi:DNA-binding MarR family transcriptional regulator